MSPQVEYEPDPNELRRRIAAEAARQHYGRSAPISTYEQVHSHSQSQDASWLWRNFLRPAVNKVKEWRRTSRELNERRKLDEVESSPSFQSEQRFIREEKLRVAETKAWREAIARRREAGEWPIVVEPPPGRVWANPPHPGATNPAPQPRPEVAIVGDGSSTPPPLPPFTYPQPDADDEEASLWLKIAMFIFVILALLKMTS